MNSKPRILVIDDEPDMLSGCTKILVALGNNPFPVSDTEVAIKLLKENDFDLIFCDLLMPVHNGMEILDICRNTAPNTPVIIFTAYGTIDRAVAAMKMGAFDFIEKPFETENLKIIIEKGLRQRSFYLERENLLEQLEEKYSFDNIIGNSPVMRKIYEMIESVSRSDVNVMITGESGTGKELIARSIHARSRRKSKPFVPVNCGAFPENLFEAELFGYEKGAFTGAVSRKSGLLEYASGGTFFLDEVCELPLSLQIKLLRTLQDQQLRRIAGHELIQVDVRLISATNRDPEKVMEEEKMRKDFFYRLNVINIHVPPLRDRIEDIPLIAEHFLKKFNSQAKKNISLFTDEVMRVFCSYRWPGNIRELENTVERAVTLAKHDKITLIDLPPQILNTEAGTGNFIGHSLIEAKQKAVEDLEKRYLLFLMEKHKGNVTKIAEEAGLTRRHIHRLINNYDMHPDVWRTSK
ncbi:MAG TPA: sigma-54 dependent transcriptional regulator [Ignavibacteriaceae bacterium]|nr:sigma-54 dependent transcriptional regulator [Ignavibacteriaceae bacterium]